MKKIFLLIIPVLILFSCTEEEHYSLDNYWIDIATVNNPENNSYFTFILDDGTRMWTAASDIKYYRPVDGQRIIANYTILSDKPESADYDHDIKLNDVYEVLTKEIFQITPGTQDSIGNDYVYIRDIWIGSDYLNVRFDYRGGNKMHFINLVSDSLKTYDDGKIHLEFRHNSNGDYPNYNLGGIVSFNLKSLRKSNANLVDIVIHTREFNHYTSQNYNLTYKYGNSSQNRIGRKIAIPENRANVK